MPWELSVIAFGLIVVISLTFFVNKLLVLYWLETEGREMVQAEVRRLEEERDHAV